MRFLILTTPNSVSQESRDIFIIGLCTRSRYKQLLFVLSYRPTPHPQWKKERLTPSISPKMSYNTQHVTKKKLMEEETHRELHEAALQGNAASLLKLLEVDSLVIERCAAGCFGQMPLHIAAMLGHLEFTTAILDQKPELAKQLDSRRWSPLHLASANGHLQVVKALLLVDPDMCFAQDPDGWSPLHVAVIKDRVEVLKELVLAKPEAVLVPGEGGETLLHLCVKQSHLNALKFLVKFVNGMDYGVLNSKDNDGLTVLHLAVARRQVEIVNFLLAKASIEVNALNANGSTALDISLAQCQRKAKDINIQDSLLQAGAISVKYAFSTGCKLEAGNTRDSSSTFGVHIRTLHNSRVKNSKKHHKRKNNNWLENKRNALMVVASLIATMAFQAGINPPGGTWQGDQQGQVSGRLFEAGHSVMADKSPRTYTAFTTFNTASFISSLSVILILISGLPIRRRSSVWLLMIIMWIAVISAMFAYVSSIYMLSKRQCMFLGITITVSLMYGAIAIVIVGHFIRLRVKIITFVRKLVKKRCCAESRLPEVTCFPIVYHNPLFFLSPLNEKLEMASASTRFETKVGASPL